MFMHKSHTRRISRLVAGLFAVQIVVTGFCLLTSQAHAMPMSQMSGSGMHMSDTVMGDMDGACGKSAHMDGQYNGTSHSGGCFHCDEPDQFVKAGTADLTQVSLVLVALSLLPEMPALAAWDETTSFYAPTGPPRSSSLLFTTTQRIRV